MSEHLLVTIGRGRFQEKKEIIVHLVDEPKANGFLNDIEHYPHAFVLACCMDRQTKSERAWMIPFKIYASLGGFSMEKLASISREEYKDLFIKQALHRFNEIMSDVWYDAVQKIVRDYNGDASKIWSQNPSSATVIYRFLQFKGVGIKIATMATNILAR